MSMHVIFLKKHEHYKAKSAHVVPRALGCILKEKGVAVPYMEYQEMLREEAEREAETKAKAKAEAEEKAKKEAEEKAKAEKAEAEKKAKLLKEKEEAKTEKATSKKAIGRSKTIKF